MSQTQQFENGFFIGALFTTEIVLRLSVLYRMFKNFLLDLFCENMFLSRKTVQGSTSF